MSKRILLIEDNVNICEAVEDYFTGKDKSISICIVMDGNIGIDVIRKEKFDLVLLDVMLPGIDGFSLCREIRRESDVPVIFLTARSREEDILYGYDLGGDDYITKPFSLAELWAKVQVMLRRTGGNVLIEQLSCGKIVINPRNYQVFVDGKEIELPPKEYEILYYLIKNKGTVCSREMILIRLWGYEYEGNERILDNHIKKLRKALGSAGKQIKTVITKGYKLMEEG